MTRSGFVAILGRPNVGKSTLLNAIVGEKVSITSSTPNTTRHAVRGIVTEGETQVVFVDTPGLHRPKSTLGGRMNATARHATSGVDVVIAMIDGRSEIGPGDRMVLSTLIEACGPTGPIPIVAVNKIDRTAHEVTAAALLAVAQCVEDLARDAGRSGVAERVEYFPVSAKTKRGVDALMSFIVERLPEGPFFYPEDEVTDIPEAEYVAELVREQLFSRMREEIPHSLHCRVTEYEWPHITVEILVERESQKGMVIGRGGQVLKDVGIDVRRQMPEGAFLELVVKVEPGWQQRDDILDRLGY
ncbi:MAG: GTPase Era [Acidobacteria bacterium]|nr:GTPase Era [Acidobacteriota bacterium]